MNRKWRRIGAGVLGAAAFVGLLVALTLRESRQTETGAEKQVPARAARQDEVPLRLGGLARREVVRGAAALAGIARLHGKTVGLTGAAVSRYGPKERGATLWVGKTPGPEEAEALIEQMTAGIRAGNSPFDGPEEIVSGGRTVYLLSGMGQRHVYFAAGSWTVWASADSSVFQRVLEDLLDWY